jgi:hypothetical protein
MFSDMDIVLVMAMALAVVMVGVCVARVSQSDLVATKKEDIGKNRKSARVFSSCETKDKSTKWRENVTSGGRASRDENQNGPHKMNETDPQRFVKVSLPVYCRTGNRTRFKRIEIHLSTIESSVVIAIHVDLTILIADFQQSKRIEFNHNHNHHRDNNGDATATASIRQHIRRYRQLSSKDERY